MNIGNLSPSSPQPLLSTVEVAKRLNIAPETVLRLSQEGVLRAVRLGPRTTRFVKAEVEALIANGNSRDGFTSSPLPLPFAPIDVVPPSVCFIVGLEDSVCFRIWAASANDEARLLDDLEGRFEIVEVELRDALAEMRALLRERAVHFVPGDVDGGRRTA